LKSKKNETDLMFKIVENLLYLSHISFCSINYHPFKCQNEVKFVEFSFPCVCVIAHDKNKQLDHNYGDIFTFRHFHEVH